MKKLFLIGIGFALATAVFAVTGLVYAQTQDPPEPQSNEELVLPYGTGGWSRGTNGRRMGGQGAFMSGGMMGFGWDEDQPGPLHDYLIPAMAEAFGLTDEQIDAFQIVRETMQGIRTELTLDEIQAAMQQAFTAAIENALADGAITEDQAEQWLERLEQIEDHASGMLLPGSQARGRMQGYRQGFNNGFQLSRQMMFDHEYIDAALAEALGISIEELQALRAEDDFSWQAYAADQGLSEEEIAALRVEVFTNAVKAALADGAITQEQADWLLQRLDTFEDQGD